MQTLVHDIVSAQKLPDPEPDDPVKSLAGDLRETFGPTTGVSIVNVDPIKARDAGGLHATASDERTLSQSNQWEAVKAFLKRVVHDPGWNR